MKNAWQNSRSSHPMPSVSPSSPPARLKFWGTRGSIAVPSPETLRYGGNTTCVELRADGEIIVLDAGSGIRALGIALDREFQARPIKLSLLITHAHWATSKASHFLDRRTILKTRFAFSVLMAQGRHSARS